MNKQANNKVRGETARDWIGFGFGVAIGSLVASSVVLAITGHHNYFTVEYEEPHTNWVVLHDNGDYRIEEAMITLTKETKLVVKVGGQALVSGSSRVLPPPYEHRLHYPVHTHLIDRNTFKETGVTTNYDDAVPNGGESYSGVMVTFTNTSGWTYLGK